MKYSKLQNKRRKKKKGRVGRKELGEGSKKEEKKKNEKEEKNITFHIMIDGVWANCICNTLIGLIDIGKFCDVTSVGYTRSREILENI